ncbi:MAG: hypothetical protein P4L96_00915 [Rhodoferax sp.]|nr:hypothetical protein [Rhodoferax sp.]
MRQLALRFFGMHGMLGRPARTSKSVIAGRMESIRLAMLDALGEIGDERFPQTIRKLRFASDVQGLWYLRGEIMEALASLHGEASARQQVEQLSVMFHGLLPGGLSSRVSPLNQFRH